MPYAADPALKVDVFVSYAHLDDGTGWVDSFHKCLTVSLDQRVGRSGAFEVWRDEHELDRTSLFDGVIRDRVRRSAVFLALCSASLKASDYCRLEFETFREAFGGSGLRAGERSRLVRVRLQNVPWDELPSGPERSGSYDFFTLEGTDTIGTVLDPDSAEFRKMINSLAQGLHQVLDELNEEYRVRIDRGTKETDSLGTGPLPAVDAPRVFLAEVCDTQRVVKKRLIAELEARKIAVAPPVPPPHTAVEHEASARASLKGCALSVHLFDQWGDDPVQGRETTTYSREQLRLADEANVRKLIWIPQKVSLSGEPSQSLDDAEQLKFLSELERAERKEDEYRIVRCPANELPSLIGTTLEKLKVDSSPERRAVLLDTHIKDQTVAFDIGKLLLENGIQPYLNPGEDQPRENTSTLAERLQQVQALVVLYGQASEEWVRSRLIEDMKLVMSSRNTLKTFGILLAPPDRGQDETVFELPFFKPVIMDGRGGVNPSSLQPILQGLGVV